MKLLIILCAVVAIATCQKCGPLQRLKVKQQWSVAFGTAKNRIDFGTAIWRGFFRQSPEAKDLFKRVNGEDIKSGAFIAHSQRVLGMLNTLISTLDDDSIMPTCLVHVREYHSNRKIPINYFQSLKNSIMKVVPAAIGRCFDESAWDVCLDVILDGITDY